MATFADTLAPTDRASFDDVGHIAKGPSGFDEKTPGELESIKMKGFESSSDVLPLDDEGNEAQHPTEEEKKTLRQVAGKLPAVAYWLCLVEFAERASFYGVKPLFNNFVNRKLPVGGNKWGAPKKGSSDTAGALGLGTKKSSAVSQSFSMLVYALPVFFGWLADAKTGRFPLIVWGVIVCGIAHVLMVACGAPQLLANHTAVAPFFISVYVLAVGAAMFKPNISPTLLDQMPVTVPVTKTLKSGEKVIIDPEATTERVMLWFYLFINIGGFFGVATTYSEKYVGWWLGFFLPLVIYLPLLPLLWYLRKHLVFYPPGGSDLGNCLKIIGLGFKNGGLLKIITFKGGFFEPAKPSVMRAAGKQVTVPWNDEFVDDCARAVQACGIFMFFPIQYINDNGLGEAANAQSTMLTAINVPNDVIGNMNSLIIICTTPMLNYGLYPLLRKMKIHYGPIARITTGLFISTLGGLGYTLINYYAYKLGPCKEYGSSASCVDADGNALVSNISVWWMAIPYALGGFSELFVNVPAYGLAYSRSPKNMRGLVSAINLFSTAIAYALGLAFSALIADPYLTWVFAGPTIVGAIATPVFWWIYKDIDKEEYKLSQNEDYHKEFQAVHNTGNSRNASVVAGRDAPQKI
ncbi:major facilitator superfamily transporter peptide [Venturia nashicola]|uniref:Major facilitator superfamily transporter peptide n=1 Tax=Venturia nashicola TaxID=86259 RepID=A0A4Z1NYX7_9PEZI|nr:major facilitator superfamily transporter peptide [Venturia nashicola]TLD25693.1 major facilitator superfamily transporter peptide [Venturia nashicola]